MSWKAQPGRTQGFEEGTSEGGKQRQERDEDGIQVQEGADGAISCENSRMAGEAEGRQRQETEGGRGSATQTQNQTQTRGLDWNLRTT